MELKPKIGELPEGWRTTQLRDQCDLISKGTTPTSIGKQFYDRGINFIKIESIESDGQILEEKLAFIDKDTHNVLCRSQLRDKDILFSIAGALGRVSLVTEKFLPANTNQALAFIRLRNNSEIDHYYLFHYLNSTEIKKHIELINVQGAQANLSLENIRDFEIKYPTHSEQRTISAALSDVDSLITTLDRLIAKKRDIKQAAMQELLTGKRRLPGFSGELSSVCLGELGSFSKGRGIKKDDVVASGIPCVRYGEIYTHYNDYIREFHSFISEEIAKESQQIRNGDLLFAGSGETAEEIGKCVAYLKDEEAYAGGDIVIFSPKKQNSMYLGYLMNHSSIIIQKARMGQGDAVVHISAKNLAELRLRLPPIDEQNAIATAFSDIDAEIATMETRREKIRALKQGMTQELLTGRIRLVQGAEA